MNVLRVSLRAEGHSLAAFAPWRENIPMNRSLQYENLSPRRKGRQGVAFGPQRNTKDIHGVTPPGSVLKIA